MPPGKVKSESDWLNGSMCNAVMIQVVSELLGAISNESDWFNVVNQFGRESDMFSASGCNQ